MRVGHTAIVEARTSDRRDPLPFEIFSSGPETFGIVAEVAEADIAAVTEQAAHIASRVIVIDMPGALAPRLRRPADRAAAPLLRKYLIKGFRR